MFQAVPGHLLGRLGQAVSYSLLDQPAEAQLLRPTQLAPGPLGIASAASGFIQVTQAKLKQVGCFTTSTTPQSRFLLTLQGTELAHLA